MDERWVRALRAQFPVTEKTAFFDIAYENCGLPLRPGGNETVL